MKKTIVQCLAAVGIMSLCLQLMGGTGLAAQCLKYEAFAVGKDHAYRLNTTVGDTGIKTHVKDSFTGTWPLNAEITPDGEKVFAPGSVEYDPWLTVIKTNGFSISTYPVVPPPYFPSLVRIRPGTTEAWIGDTNGRAVMIVDTVTEQVIDTFDIPGYTDDHAIRGLEFNADGSTLYVNLYYPGALLAIDSETYSLRKRLYLAGYSGGPLALSQDGRFLYTAVGGTLAVLDTATNTIIARTSYLFSPIKDLAVSSDDATLYVGSYSGVQLVDTALLVTDPDASIVGDLPVGSVWGVALTPDDAYLYAADTNGIFKIIDTRDLSVMESFNFQAYDVVTLPFCAE